ncbi:MAG TPA: phospholipase D-like domain-containing protein [Acidimicrobiales bacterium]|nr:phospholipase D-like domain-containing protein [Acidimicrobiales bacterium]
MVTTGNPRDTPDRRPAVGRTPSPKLRPLRQAVIGATAAVFALGGCSPPVGPDPTASGAGHALALRVEPGDGYRSVDLMIAGARRTVDMSMYELADARTQALLIAAARRGVSVRVLLDRAYHGASVNQAAFAQLRRSGVPVRWAPERTLLHQKTVTTDGTASAILTGNLTSRHYRTTRDFTVIDRDPAAVSAMESVFAGDWRGQPVRTVPAVAGLVWSPGAGPALIGLVDSARNTLLAENEEMASAPVEAALEAAARRGVDVEVVLDAGAADGADLDALTGAGVRVATSPGPPLALYPHAKAIVADATTAFLGSQNFSTAGLDRNRELGLITDDPIVVGPLWRALRDDLSHARCGPPRPGQRAWRTASAALTVRPGPGSTLSAVTTPSTMTMAYRCERVPRPNPLPSISRPTARVKSPLPSASKVTRSPTCWASPQAAITKGSLTEMQATVSTPFAFSSSWRMTKLGRW